MADQQPPLKAPFPPPPPFYKSFTKVNRANLRRLRQGSRAGQHDDDSSILDLPPELRYLIPPQPPADGTWSSYSENLSQTPAQTTLTDHGIEQLYPSPPHGHALSNPQPHLLALARSLLTTFLSLVGILSRNPELYAQKVEDLQTISYNMHELINQYRPHQARETLILMMEERVLRLREETRRVREGRERVGGLLRGLVGGEVGSDMGKEDGNGRTGVEETAKSEKDARKMRERSAWYAVERETATEADEAGTNS